MDINEAGHPILTRLSRRQFLRLSGAVAGGGAAACMLARKGVEAQAAPTGTVRSFDLPHEPNHNPGFQARDLGENGVLLWTNQARGGFKAYRLNTYGRRVWRLCDGTRSIQEVSQAYVQEFHRPAHESEDFIQELVHAGIIAAGSHIVASRDFVLPYPGKSYHVRLTAADPGGG